MLQCYAYEDYREVMSENGERVKDGGLRVQECERHVGEDTKEVEEIHLEKIHREQAKEEKIQLKPEHWEQEHRGIEDREKEAQQHHHEQLVSREQHVLKIGKSPRSQEAQLAINKETEKTQSPLTFPTSVHNPPEQDYDFDYEDKELRLLEQEEAALRRLEEQEMSEVSPRPNDPHLSVPSIPNTPKTPGFQAINEEESEEEDEDRKVKKQ